jgi:acetyl-CoA carboxylase carboxyl transferase subunit beta
MALFGKPKYTIVRLKRKDIPDGLWTKCEECGEVLYNKTLEENFKVCPKCNYHFILGAYERLETIIDKGTFGEFDRDMSSQDPLDFKGPKTYKEKLAADQAATGLKDAVVT